MIEIPVLDKGFVRFKDDWVLGANDLEVVNSAKISFHKETNELTWKEQKLIKYLAKHGHTSPFRHSVIKFHVKAPLMICRQWWKYIVGSGHDESLQSPMEAWNECCLPAEQTINGWDCDYTVGCLVENGWKNLSIRSELDGSIVENEIKDIWESGIQEVLSIIDQLGHTVQLTANHRVLTSEGWQEAGSLKVGDTIVHNGVPPYKYKLGKSKITSITAIGKKPVYDIEMVGVDNFIAGGFVVHNSRRYVSTGNEYYLPKEWRLAAKNNKQGSVTGISPDLNTKLSEKYGEALLQCDMLYQEALADGIAPEMARLFLPSSALYTEWYWTTSLQSACHFVVQRMHEGAQVEIQEYAKAILVILEQLMPEATRALIK